MSTRAEGGSGLLDARVDLLLVGDIHGDGDGGLAVAELAAPPAVAASRLRSAMATLPPAST